MSAPNDPSHQERIRAVVPVHGGPSEADYRARIEELEARLAALEEERAAPPPPKVRTRNTTLFFERIGLLLAWVLLILVLGALRPDQMFAWNSYATMFGSNAMVVVLTLALMIPLVAGDFDLSVAAVMGLSSMMIAILNAQFGMPVIPAILCALAAGAAIGAVNAFFTVYFGIHSLIVTLGSGYFVSGIILWISNANTVAGVSMELVNAVILTRVLGIPIGFYYALILAVVIWYVFQHTSLGRRLLFVGRGREVARLSGVNVAKMRAGAFIAAGMCAAFAGVLYTGMRGAADPSSALAFLLPAFAAAFLATGIMGLNFLGVDSFVQNLFYGGGLILAVTISQVIRGRKAMD